MVTSLAVLVGVVLPNRRLIQLPAGIVELRSEMIIPGNTELRGAPGGTVLRLGSDFRGRAAIVVRGREVVLRDFQNKEIILAAKNVEEIRPSAKSLMPDGQLAGLTIQEAADLLEYVATRR